MIKNWQDDPTLQLVMKKIGVDYDVVTYLGGGGLARVYKVYHKLLKEPRVLKIMDFHYILQLFEKSGVTDIGPEFKKIKDRFANEAKAYKKISHPGIIKVYQPGYVEYENNREKIQIPYLILEYVEGASLKAVLKKKPPLKIETVLKISEDVLATLDTIHQKGIIHRDVKPSNIMIRVETGEAVLIDFGLAKDLDDQESIGITVTRTAMGSAHYMPPEMYMDSKNITREADLYSFGIILYEMITANVPFRGNFMEVMHGHMQMPVPEAEVFNKSIFGKEIRKIIVKALAKDAKDRYRSAADFLMALEELKVELVKTGEIDEEYFKDEKKYLKEVTIEDKPRKKFYERPIVWVLSIILLATLILLFLKIIPGVIAIKKMTKDYEDLRQYERGSAENHAKLDRCREFLAMHQNVPTTDETKVIRAEIAKYMVALQNGIQADEQINGNEEYNAVKTNIKLENYLSFKSKYPAFRYLSDLKARLIKADENLPPEKYWEQGLTRNRKGYYELTFNDHNGHLMIYIPEKKIWIDKYEVSWAQFGKFIKEGNTQFIPKMGDKYICGSPGCPAVVTNEEAQKYCQVYGLKLPSAEEWEYAAGKGKSIYPWGNESPDENGIWRANYDSLEGGVEKDGFVGTAPVNCFEKFSSPFGVVNMAGNVWEWVQGNILKGGGYLSSKEELKIQNSKTGNDDKAGFRCIKLEK